MLCMYVLVSVSMDVRVSAEPMKKRAPDALQLELQVVAGTELLVSAAGALDL